MLPSIWFVCILSRGLASWPILVVNLPLCWASYLGTLYSKLRYPSQDPILPPSPIVKTPTTCWLNFLELGADPFSLAGRASCRRGCFLLRSLPGILLLQLRRTGDLPPGCFLIILRRKRQECHAIMWLPCCHVARWLPRCHAVVWLSWCQTALFQ